MEMEWKQLEALLDRFGQADISELELETEKLKLHLKKEEKADSESFLLSEGKERGKARVLEAGKEEAAEEEKSDGEKKKAEEKEAGRAVKAPLVGTFYAAAEPGAEPYVREGQEVKKGEVIGLIEAMKIMNEIPAPCNGRVTKILAENGSFVAYDEVLLYIEE
jgi:acetyl-CoA carboxylase biotin carboxyl carrier protein